MFNELGVISDAITHINQDITETNNKIINLEDKIMTKEEITKIVTESVNAVMPTMAEAIAKALSKYVGTVPNASKTASNTDTASTPTPTASTPSSKSAVIFEYSANNWAMLGSIKEDADALKKIGAWKWGKLRAFNDGSSEGWLVSIKECPSLDSLNKSLVSLGYSVVIGESCKARFEELHAADNAANEAKNDVPKASAPVAPVAPKVVPIKVKEITPDFDNVLTFDSSRVFTPTMNGTLKESEMTIKSIPTLLSAYYAEVNGVERIYLYVENSEQAPIFVFVGMAKTIGNKPLSGGGTLENHEVIEKVAKVGITNAIKQGLLSEALKAVCEKALNSVA